MNKDTEKALSRLIKAGEEFEKKVQKYDPDQESDTTPGSEDQLQELSHAFQTFKEARREYYRLRAREENWSENELQSYIEIPASRNHCCKTRCFQTSEPVNKKNAAPKGKKVNKKGL